MRARAADGIPDSSTQRRIASRAPRAVSAPPDALRKQAADAPCSTPVARGSVVPRPGSGSPRPPPARRTGARAPCALADHAEASPPDVDPVHGERCQLADPHPCRVQQLEHRRVPAGQRLVANDSTPGRGDEAGRLVDGQDPGQAGRSSRRADARQRVRVDLAAPQGVTVEGADRGQPTSDRARREPAVGERGQDSRGSRRGPGCATRRRGRRGRLRNSPALRRYSDTVPGDALRARRAARNASSAAPASAAIGSASAARRAGHRVRTSACGLWSDVHRYAGFPCRGGRRRRADGLPRTRHGPPGARRPAPG